MICVLCNQEVPGPLLSMAALPRGAVKHFGNRGDLKMPLSYERKDVCCSCVRNILKAARELGL